jgi:hypothetical protein
MSQDSMLGQSSFTGFRPVDVPLNVLSVLGAATGRGGALGQMLINQQMARQQLTLDRLRALQDPAVRESLTTDPRAREALGVESFDATAPIHQLNPIGRRIAASTTSPRTLPILPRQVETEDTARTKLLGAQAGNETAQARLLSNYINSQGGSMGAAGQLGVDAPTLRVGGLTIPLGANAPDSNVLRDLGVVRQRFPALGPIIDQLGNRALTDPRVADALNAVQRERAAGNAPAAQAVRGQLNRLDSALAAFDGLGEPVQFPNGSKITIYDAMGQFTTPGIGQGGILGTAGELLQGLPGASTVAESRLAAWANDKNVPEPERRARQQVVAKVTTAQGLVANAVKALGDAGALAVQEQESLRKAFLPVPGEDPGASRAKIMRAQEIMRQMRDQLRKGATRADVRAFLSNATGIAFAGDPEKRSQDSEVVTDIDIEQGTATGGQTAPASRGRSSYDANTLKAFKQELFGAP